MKTTSKESDLRSYMDKFRSFERFVSYSFTFLGYKLSDIRSYKTKKATTFTGGKKTQNHINT